MNQISVSAPGKLLLLGDHAVVHSRPCIVTAVGQRMHAVVTILDEKEFQLEAPNVDVTGYRKPMSALGSGDIPRGAKFVEFAVKNFIEKYAVPGVRIETSSEFSSLFGFGSSSASTVCVLTALSYLWNAKLENKGIFELAYKTVMDIQGVGSGFDIAAAIYGGVLYFVGGGAVIEPINAPMLSLIVGYSGMKADTPTMVNAVSAKVEKHPTIYPRLFDISNTVVDEGKQALVNGDRELLGELMNVNEGLLSAYGAENSKLAAMIHAAREAGAYGAKLSGAGGGDCMIAVGPLNLTQEIKFAISDAGGQLLEVETNVEGVRIEI